MFTGDLLYSSYPLRITPVSVFFLVVKSSVESNLFLAPRSYIQKGGGQSFGINGVKGKVLCSEAQDPDFYLYDPQRKLITIACSCDRSGEETRIGNPVLNASSAWPNPTKLKSQREIRSQTRSMAS